ncbi:MAG: HDOD domain-containing protein [Nitrospiraceae bacterium]|nr:MAG: HDOD domain-containing protein [Nitrospiraceae bacterium]
MRENTVTNDSLKIFVQKIPVLPTLPTIAQEILMVLDDDLVSTRKLENIIEHDPAISVKVLSVANSAFWGMKSRVSTLGEAIFRIGFNSVKYLAVGVSLMTLFDDGDRSKTRLYQKMFNHSVAVGMIAKLLAKDLKLAFSEEIIISGLLHDIGILVLNRHFSGPYSDVMKSLESGIPLLDSEKTLLNFTHAEIGGWLAEEWNLPDTVIRTTLYHHGPFLEKQGSSKQMALVHIADYLTTKKILSATEHDPQYPFEETCLDVLRISGKQLESLELRLGNGELFSGLFI